jgi:two-component system CheB/CheR fusion protein
VERGQAVERRVTAHDGGLHYLMRILPYRMSDKLANGALITFVDITNVIRAEEHEKSLVAELNNRVHSILDSVISLTTNTLKRSETLDDFSEGLLDRFHALARTHDVLSKTRWVDTPLADLVAAELTPYAGQNLRKVNIRGPDVHLLPKAAVALGMAIHELATCAARSGAFSVAKGRVDIEWSLRGKRSARLLELSWSERGGPPIAKGERSGTELSFVTRGVHSELGGSTKLEFPSSGLQCVIRMPAADNVSAVKHGKD